MDMLSTCDGRLQALMAEANLLGETASSQTQTSAEDLELRQVFASILIESGEAWTCCSSGANCQLQGLLFKRALHDACRHTSQPVAACHVMHARSCTYSA